MSPDLIPQCTATTVLTAEEMARLDALPDGAHMVEPDHVCAILQDGHDGPHLTLGQECGDDEWWLVWDGAELREFRVLPPCPVEDVELEESCLLPVDHEGPHTCAA